MNSWNPKDIRWPLVLHVDMDAFFASVETRSDPRLSGRPVVVGGGPGDRGVVTTASYPARKFGVKSGMAMAEARRLCPHLLALPVNPSKYVHESLAVLAILDRVSPRVEAASIDEAYLAFPPPPRELWEERAHELGGLIRRLVRRERGLPCSVGAAVNKLQAKMASPLAKPDGVCALAPDRFLETFGSREVTVVPGLGPRTAQALAGMGIHTLDQLARAPVGTLRSVFGKGGELLHDHARGEDSRSVHGAGDESGPRSAGHETTFARDVRDPVHLRATLWLLADRVARRLRLGGYTARTAVVRFKVGRKRYSRQRTLPRPVDDARSLALHAWDLLEPARAGRALRLVGVAGANLLETNGEALLFEGDRRHEALIQAGDRLRGRFGERTIRPGAVFLRHQEVGRRLGFHPERERLLRPRTPGVEPPTDMRATGAEPPDPRGAGIAPSDPRATGAEPPDTEETG